MGVFHVFKIVQKVPNRAKYHNFSFVLSNTQEQELYSQSNNWLLLLVKQSITIV